MAEQTLELTIGGMDCPDCALRVEKAIAVLPGVATVRASLVAEKSFVRPDPKLVNRAALQQAVAAAGYSVKLPQPAPAMPPAGDFTRRVLTLSGLVFGAVLFVVIVGEWLGLFAAITARLPWPVGLALVLLGGYPSSATSSAPRSRAR